FATLNRLGTRITGPTPITSNTLWGTWDDDNIPELWQPTIAATSDNRFVISWTESNWMENGYQENVWYAVRDTAGGSVKAPTALTTGNTGWGPILNSLSNGRVILLWRDYDPYYDAVHYAIINSSGGIVKPETSLDLGIPRTTNTWAGYDAVQLPDGKIAVAWIDGPVIVLVFLNGSSYNLESGPYYGSDIFYGGGLSLTTSASGRIIMT